MIFNFAGGQQCWLRNVCAFPETHSAEHARQHDQFNPHVQTLPPLSHQVLKGVHSQQDAGKNVGFPQGAKSRPSRKQVHR